MLNSVSGATNEAACLKAMSTLQQLPRALFVDGVCSQLRAVVVGLIPQSSTLAVQ